VSSKPPGTTKRCAILLLHAEPVKMKGASQRDISGIIAAGRPYTTNAGKDVHVRVKRVDNAEVTEIRSWSAHERIVVKRTGGGNDSRRGD
jgi:hypothetical protein